MTRPLVGILTVSILFMGAASSQATMPIQKKAKDAGFPAANCLYCHQEKMPAKGKNTYNERGAFLNKTKEEKKAKDVDVAWLKDFVEAKK